LWGLIDGKDVNPNEGDAMAISTYAKGESQALNFILQSFFNNQLFIVKKETTTKGLIWEAFQKWYVDKVLMNTLFLTRKFFTSQMGPNDRMEQHLNKLKTMAKDLNAIGAPILVRVKVINGHVNEFA